MAQTAGTKTDSEQLVKISKIVVAGVWMFACASFFSPAYDWPTGGFMRTLFGLLAVTHLVEYPFYHRLFREVGGSMLGHFLSTIAYGIIYYTEVKRRHASS